MLFLLHLDSPAMASILKIQELILYTHNSLLNLDSGFKEIKEKYEIMPKNCCLLGS